MSRDERIDAQIATAAPFARPILDHLRELVHATWPETEETVKWGRPFFCANGRPFAFMAAFKAHAAFGFWQGTATGREAEAAGQFGRLTTLADLPSDEDLGALIRTAAEAAGAKRAPRPRPAVRAAPELPADFAAALADNAAASSGYGQLTTGQQRDYVDWITAAKRPETRWRRIARATALLAEGKDRNGTSRRPNLV